MACSVVVVSGAPDAPQLSAEDAAVGTTETVAVPMGELQAGQEPLFPVSVATTLVDPAGALQAGIDGAGPSDEGAGAHEPPLPPEVAGDDSSALDHSPHSSEDEALVVVVDFETGSTDELQSPHAIVEEVVVVVVVFEAGSTEEELQSPQAMVVVVEVVVVDFDAGSTTDEELQSPHAAVVEEEVVAL